MGVDVARVPLLEVVVHHGRQKIVRSRHGVEIARQVQIEVLERHHLAVPAAGRAAFDPEGRPHGRLTDGDGRLLAQAGECLPEADGRGGLALSERGRRNGRHHDVAGLRPVRQDFDGI